MSDLPQDWGFLGSTSRGRPAGDSGSKEEEIPFIDNAEPAHWTQTCTAPEPSGFSDIFQILSDIHLQEPSPPPTAKAVDTLRNNLGGTEHVEPGNSTRKRKVHDLELRKCPSEGNEQLSSEAKRKEGQKPKRTRSAETHNMSERRRRDRIKEKIRSLHQLIPNSDKKDCASILDEAVGYMKTLKVQAQMMSMIMGTVYYNPYMSATGIQNMPVDQYSPYVPFRPGLGLVPLVPIPSPPKNSPGLQHLVQGPMELDPSLPIPGTGGLPAMRPTNTAMPPPHLDSKGKGPAFKELEMANSGSQEASTSGQISSNFNPGSIVHATHIVPPATKGHHTNM